jgi:plastocyanin
MRKIATLGFAGALTLTAAFGLAGCGEGKDGGGKKGPDKKDDTADKSGGALQKPDLAGGATIRGFVKFDGTPPENKPLQMDAEAFCVAVHGEAGLKSESYMVKDGKVANVIVWAKKGVSGKWELPSSPVVLDQKGCRYDPHVTGLMVGQELLIRNSDDVSHNVHATGAQEFNFAQTKKGAEDRRKFVMEEIVRVKCDIHGWMGCVLLVAKHPFFAVTKEDGAFELKGLPPGEYEIEAAHEKWGKQSQKVTVAAKDSKEITFTFKSE